MHNSSLGLRGSLTHAKGGAHLAPPFDPSSELACATLDQRGNDDASGSCRGPGGRRPVACDGLFHQRDAHPDAPWPPLLQTIGILAGLREDAGTFAYTLIDGRTWTRVKDQFRIRYDMASDRTLFVAGNDEQGSYVLLIGSQQGVCRIRVCTPSDTAGASGAIRSRAGDSCGARARHSRVSIRASPSARSALSERCRACLDNAATVTGVLRATPEGGISMAAGASVSVP